MVLSLYRMICQKIQRRESQGEDNDESYVQPKSEYDYIVAFVKGVFAGSLWML